VLGAATNHADLTFHALAFVPPRLDAPAVVRAASLHRPAWMRFAEQRMPPAAVVPIARDAPLVGGLCGSAAAAIALQRFALLHETIAGFLAAVRRPLAELGPGDVARPGDLAALQAAPAAPIEIFRAALGLAARAFAAVHTTALRPFAERVIEGLAPRLARLSGEVPGLGSLEVRVSATLGPRGRLFEDLMLVGTGTLPDEAGAVDTDAPLLLVAHEGAVRAAAAVLREQRTEAAWALTERVALDAGEQAYRGTCVAAAYGAWRAALDEHGLATRDRALRALVEATVVRLRPA
jgi:hypothetical protein